MAKLTAIRRRKMKAQGYRCFYCTAPMWSGRPDKFCRRYGVTKRSAHHFRCTAEHLLARCDGGADTDCNIVAACSYCNQMRHQLKRPPDPETYRERVLRRVTRGTYRTVLKEEHRARAKAMRRAEARRRTRTRTRGEAGSA